MKRTRALQIATATLPPLSVHHAAPLDDKARGGADVAHDGFARRPGSSNGSETPKPSRVKT